MQISGFPLLAAAVGLTFASAAGAQETAPADPPEATAPVVVEPEGEPTNVAPEGEPTNFEPEGEPDTVAPEGAPANVEPEGVPTSADPEGAPADALPGGEPASAAPEGGSGTDGAATVLPEAAAPEGEATTGGAGLSGDTAAGEAREIVRDTFGDWEVRCLPDGADCFMYQLALDVDDNPVAEVSLLRLPAGGDADAGATVVTPLGTLLTAGVVFQVDTGDQRQYPFNWCSQVGCFARFGLDAGAVAGMKRGREGSLTVVSVGAPDQPITVTVSLDGFTMAYDTLAVPQ